MNASENADYFGSTSLKMCDFHNDVTLRISEETLLSTTLVSEGVSLSLYPVKFIISIPRGTNAHSVF